MSFLNTLKMHLTADFTRKISEKFDYIHVNICSTIYPFSFVCTLMDEQINHQSVIGSPSFSSQLQLMLLLYIFMAFKLIPMLEKPPS